MVCDLRPTIASHHATASSRPPRRGHADRRDDSRHPRRAARWPGRYPDRVHRDRGRSARGPSLPERGPGRELRPLGRRRRRSQEPQHLVRRDGSRRPLEDDGPRARLHSRLRSLRVVFHVLRSRGPDEFQRRVARDRRDDQPAERAARGSWGSVLASRISCPARERDPDLRAREAADHGQIPSVGRRIGRWRSATRYAAFSARRAGREIAADSEREWRDGRPACGNVSHCR